MYAISSVAEEKTTGGKWGRKGVVLEAMRTC